MNMPKLIDISTQIIITIDENKKLEDAVRTMYEHDIRDIIITQEGAQNYWLITSNDLIRFKREQVRFDIQIKELKIDHLNTIADDKSLIYALKEMRSSTDCLYLLNEDKVLCGFVNYADIIGSIDPSILIKEQPLRDMLWSNSIKKADIHTAACDVLSMMSHVVQDAVIIYDGKKAVGIITSKDTIRLLHKGSDLKKAIKNYMSSPIRSIKENTNIEVALDFLQKEHFKRVIVSDEDGNIIAQISQQELLSKVYSRWTENLKAHDQQLQELNLVLEERAIKYAELAQYDALTRLPNRATFEEKMLDEIERIERYNSGAFSLIFFDIDHFKRINDTHGHLVGDHVLKSISNLCKGLLRSNDMLARWGGEEFVAILPMTDDDAALLVAEKLRTNIEKYIFEQVGHITCSFGISKYKKSDEPNTLLHRTDQAMYEAKEKGRNCSVQR